MMKTILLIFSLIHVDEIVHIVSDSLSVPVLCASLVVNLA